MHLDKTWVTSRHSQLKACYLVLSKVWQALKGSSVYTKSGPVKMRMSHLSRQSLCMQNAAFARQRWIAFLAMFVGYAHLTYSPFPSLHVISQERTVSVPIGFAWRMGIEVGFSMTKSPCRPSM